MAIYQHVKMTYHNHDMEDYITIIDITIILHTTSEPSVHLTPMYVKLYFNLCMHILSHRDTQTNMHTYTVDRENFGVKKARKIKI